MLSLMFVVLKLKTAATACPKILFFSFIDEAIYPLRAVHENANISYKY